MKKVVFLAEFICILFDVMGMSANNVKKNVQHDNVDMCQRLHLTQTEADQFLKSRKEREIVDEKCKRFSQQMNKIFSNQKPQKHLDDKKRSISSLLQFSNADEYINKCLENPSQIQKKQKVQFSIFPANNINRINQNKIFNAHKTSEKQKVPSLNQILKGTEGINADNRKKRKYKDISKDTNSQSELENLNISNYISPKRKKIIVSDNSSEKVIGIKNR